jgi:hypothetical protein
VSSSYIVSLLTVPEASGNIVIFLYITSCVCFGCILLGHLEARCPSPLYLEHNILLLYLYPYLQLRVIVVVLLWVSLRFGFLGKSRS